MRSETDEIIKDRSESLLQKFHEGLEESMKRSKFIFDSVNVLNYDLNKISLNRGGSYIDYPKWLKNKKVTVNLNNNGDKCFQHALAVALSYQSIENNLERISKIKPYIDQYNWKERHFPSHIKDWKKFESNNKSVALNILYVPYNIEEIRHPYMSKYILKHENQVILLIITDDKKWYYLAVKSLSALCKGITSKNNGDFYCTNCFHSFRAENKLKKMKIYAKIMIIAM